jgi:hypothetical protein
VGAAPVDGVDENGLEILDEEREGNNGYLSGEKDSEQIRGPSGRPTIQFDTASIGREGEGEGGYRYVGVNRDRQQFIKGMIQHAWTGYLQHAAPHDELRSVTGEGMDPFHGWGATLIESLDTLKLVGLEKEYFAAKEMFLDLIQSHHWGGGGDNDRAQNKKDENYNYDDDDRINDDEPVENVSSLKSIGIDSSSIASGRDGQDIGFFEGVVRYLGGLISIKELETEKEKDNDERIIQSAVHLADRLVLAFQGVNNAIPESRILARYV